MKNEQTEIERVEIDEDPPTASFITTDFIEKFEEAADLYQSRYLPACLRLTQASDWVKMGSRFFLQSTGAEKVAIPLGIEWKNLDIAKNDIGGGHYEYVVSGHITSKLLKREIYCTGNCDSRDPFLSAQGPPEEGNIRKSAMSNFITNGVSRIAGIRNPSLEMLKRAGINPGAVGSVDYSGSGRTADESKQPINEAQTKKLWATFKGRNLGDDNILREIIGRDPWKYTSSKDIQRGHFNAILKAVEEYKPTEGNGRQPGEEG